jgi:hypothetical protein
LGVWIGKKAEFQGYWLRWWDKSGNLLLWGSELVNRERQRAEQAEQKVIKLAEKLQAMGISLEDI